MFELKRKFEGDSNDSPVLKPGLNKVQVQFNLTKKGDIVINFKKSKEVRAALWLNDSENKTFEGSTTTNNVVIDAATKKMYYEQSVVNALRQVFNALVGNETEWVAMSNQVEGKVTMSELYNLIKDYLETNHADYWKTRVYVALTQYKNNLSVACFQQSKNNGKWYTDTTFRTKFCSKDPFEVPYFNDYASDEVVIEETPVVNEDPGW